MSEPTIYHGNCHCGLFKFTLNSPPIKTAISCDCSYCSRVGYILPEGFIKEENVVVEKGDYESLKAYLFGSKRVKHLFCPTCGTSLMMKFGSNMKINYRTLRDLDIDTIEIKKVGGASLGAPYVPPNPPALQLEPDDSKKIYSGNCHCNAVLYNVQTKPFTDPDQKVMNCNCSLCFRNGSLFIYPSKKDVQLQGGDALTEYVFVTKTASHTFCSTCSVSMVVRIADPTDKCPLNVRTINGIDLDSLTLQKYDGRSKDPQYVV